MTKKNIFTEFFSIFLAKKKYKTLILISILILNGVLETMAIFSFIPVLGYLQGTEEMINLINPALDSVRSLLSLNITTQSILIILYILLLVAAFFSQVFSSWYSSDFCAQTSTNIQKTLYESILDSPYKTVLSTSASYIKTNVMIESIRVSEHILLPVVRAVGRIAAGIIILVSLTFYSPIISISAGLVLALFYFLYSKSVQKRFKDNSVAISTTIKSKDSAVTESIDLKQESILLRVNQFFLDRFTEVDAELINAKRYNYHFSVLPRFFIEFFIFFGIILYISYNLTYTSAIPTNVFQELIIFGLAAIRLLPIFQQTFYTFSSVRGNISALENVISFYNKFNIKYDAQESYNLSREGLEVYKISKKFGNKIIFNDLTFSVEKNQFVTIVGASGSGKSTLLDCIAGLHDIDSGKINVPKHMTKNKLFDVAYLKQESRLINDTIFKNITMGRILKSKKEDIQRVKGLLTNLGLSHLASDEVLYTSIGSGKLKLSGGQVQRVCLARVLYSRPKLLLLDEFSSALDAQTEKKVLNFLQELRDTTIICSAHKDDVIKRSDKVIDLN